jgi:hypothetical protein
MSSIAGAVVFGKSLMCVAGGQGLVYIGRTPVHQLATDFSNNPDFLQRAGTDLGGNHKKMAGLVEGVLQRQAVTSFYWLAASWRSNPAILTPTLGKEGQMPLSPYKNVLRC